MRACHWVSDKDVPGGKFLVPGCWNRALNGDDAECHCPSSEMTTDEKLETIMARLDKIERALSSQEQRK